MEFRITPKNIPHQKTVPWERESSCRAYSDLIRDDGTCRSRDNVLSYPQEGRILIHRDMTDISKEGQGDSTTPNPTMLLIAVCHNFVTKVAGANEVIERLVRPRTRG
jgi:hypothetical protein